MFSTVCKNYKHKRCFFFVNPAHHICNCSASLRPADCVVKPRRCAASPAFYALSTELMKTDHFTIPLRGDYTKNAPDKNLHISFQLILFIFCFNFIMSEFN
jgi:hypothetical protein